MYSNFLLLSLYLLFVCYIRLWWIRFKHMRIHFSHKSRIFDWYKHVDAWKKKKEYRVMYAFIGLALRFSCSLNSIYSFLFTKQAHLWQLLNLHMIPIHTSKKIKKSAFSWNPKENYLFEKHQQSTAKYCM